MISAAPDVPWQELEHAFGRASDVPPLLAALAESRGWKLKKGMEQLWERVLHQGSIYSASAPAVEALIPLAAHAAGSDKTLYYDVLAEFASSARQAVRNGRAIPCCSGGDPEHGRAILTHLLNARDQFAADLGSSNRTLRHLAAALLCCSEEAPSESARLVCDRFGIEKDPGTKLELLHDLERVSGRIPNWTAFLASALERESDPALRFALRHAQIRQLKITADDAASAELVALFVAACDEVATVDFDAYFEALQWLGPERELAGLLQVLERCGNRHVIHRIVQGVLRLVFEDERSGWENVSCTVLSVDHAGRPSARQSNHGLPSPAAVLRGLLKIGLLVVVWRVFPFLLRRRLRKTRDERNRKRYRIEYNEVKGSRPGLPSPLKPGQQRALSALASRPELWVDQTNLWELFGLPDTAEGLRALLAGGRHN